MHKITFVSSGIMNDMYDRLYNWYNESRNEEGIPKYDVKYTACTSVAANPNTTVITYEEETNEDGEIIRYNPIENDTTENVQKKYKHCIHVFYELNE